MDSIFQLFLLQLALIIPRKERHFFATCYIRSMPYRMRQNISYKLFSSPNKFSDLVSMGRSDGNDSLDATGSNRINIHKEKNSQKKIEFVNFWGTKLTSNEKNETAEAVDPRYVPFVPTLDARDGPLPPGAYIMEGKSEYDTKSTCRITIDVKTVDVDAMDNSDAIVRRLQACVDAGFDTFQLRDQTSRSLGLVRSMNENTPSYINKHWCISLKIQSIPPALKSLSKKRNLRHSVLSLIEQTGSDALDSLKVDFGNLHAEQSISSGDTALEMFEHLVDLQREGWIRSIGVGGMESRKLRHDAATYFGDYIDFEEQEGSVLMPPFSSGFCNPKGKIRIANVLADGLLTDLYNNNCLCGKMKNDSSSNFQLLLTNDNINLLKEWAKRRELQQKIPSTPMSIWQQYQEHIVAQLNWISMKHDVSISAVALRWALECGSAAIATNGKGPIVSSALADIAFDDQKDELAQKLRELRQVFQFQLDEEDRHILFDLSASQHDESPSNEHENLNIDFNNPSLWL